MIIPMAEAKQLRIPTSLEYVKDTRAFMEKILEEHKVPMKLAMKIMLVVDEAVSNAIDHGASNTGEGEVMLTCHIDEKKLQLMVEDFEGKPFDPDYFERIAKAKKWGKGGRGILLINKIMDEVIYLSEKGQSTLLYVVKYLNEDEQE